MKTIERIFKGTVQVFSAMTASIGVKIHDEIGERPWLAIRTPAEGSAPGSVTILNLLPSPGSGYDTMDYLAKTNIVTATDITGGKALLLAKLSDDVAAERWQLLVSELDRLKALEPEKHETIKRRSTEEKMKRLRKLRKENIRRGLVNITRGAACTEVGTSPNTLKEYDPELADRWDDPEYE